MPIIWRYLLSHYLKTFFLCIVAFVAILLTLRLEQIVAFATLTPDISLVFFFIFYQIPYIMPLAVPIAACFAAWLTFRQLSVNHEITALRAQGFSLAAILTPLLVASIYLGIGNFYAVSEVSTYAHKAADSLKSELKAFNPLVLLQSKRLLHLRGAHFLILGQSVKAEKAQDCLLALPGKKNMSINWLAAKNLLVTDDGLEGQGATFAADLIGKDGERSLLVENVDYFTMPVYEASQLMHTKKSTKEDDEVGIKELLSQYRKVDRALNENLSIDPLEIKKLFQQKVQYGSEIARRFSAALALFSFTLLGACCGLTIQRETSWKPAAIVVFSILIYIAALFVAKGIAHSLIVAVAIYLLPQLVIILAAMRRQRQIASGKI